MEVFMNIPNLDKLSNGSLVENIQGLRKMENEAISEIVLHLAEVDKRALYRELGYSSLFSYCTLGLKYSEGSAQRRIQAARALKSNPEIYSLLKDGKLSLCAVLEISKVTDDSNKRELLILSQ